MQNLPVSAAMTENPFFKSIRKQSCSLHSRNTSACSAESPDFQNRGGTVLCCLLKNDYFVIIMLSLLLLYKILWYQLTTKNWNFQDKMQKTSFIEPRLSLDLPQQIPPDGSGKIPDIPDVGEIFPENLPLRRQFFLLSGKHA